MVVVVVCGGSSDGGEWSLVACCWWGFVDLVRGAVEFDPEHDGENQRPGGVEARDFRTTSNVHQLHARERKVGPCRRGGK